MSTKVREASRAVAERKAQQQAERQRKKDEQDGLKSYREERKRLGIVAESLPIRDIFIVGERRPLNPAKVRQLAESIQRIGLHTPITVRIDDTILDPDSGEEMGGYAVVTGHHRLEACRELGREYIPAIVRERNYTEQDARLWEISENLHRSELTPLEQAQHVEEWRRLTVAEDGKGAQLGHPLGKATQPHDKGIAKTAKALGMSRPAVQRAVKIATLSPEAVEAAKTTGMDKNSRALLQAAEQTSPAAQVRLIHQQAERARSREGGKTPDDRVSELQEDWTAALAKARKGTDRSEVLIDVLRSRFRSSAMEVIAAMSVPQIQDEAKREIDALPLFADEIAEMVAEAGRVKALEICERLVQTTR